MNKKGIGKFICGAAIGAGLGILFAPKKGSETRKELKEKTEKLAKDVKNMDKKDIKNKLEKKVKELKKELENLDKETVTETIKEKGNALLKKADELLILAKEKSAPVAMQAAEDIKAKTVVLLQKAIDKLEETPKKKTTKKAKTTKKKAS